MFLKCSTTVHVCIVQYDTQLLYISQQSESGGIIRTVVCSTMIYIYYDMIAAQRFQSKVTYRQ
jgi:hypothetical protein